MLDRLVKIVDKGSKRVGRGYGSGKGGHTTGRGNKGQKARSRVSLLFEGTKTKKSLIQRLPLWRGKGRLKPKPKPVGINLDLLEKYFASGQKVTLESLIKKGVIKKREAKFGVKILGRGQLTKSLIVALPCSQSAKEIIQKVGGRVIDSSLGKA